MNTVKRTTLKKRAESNLSIKRGKESVKEGTPLDHEAKHFPSSARTVGMNLGITRNMGDYESLRVDVWLTNTVEEGETHKEAFERVEAILDEVLEEAVMSKIE